jgi:uncharacterized membrane protein
MTLRRTLIAGSWGLLLAAVSVALAGCGSDDPAVAEGKPTDSTCPTGSTLNYESFGSHFMMSYCTRCHSSSVTGDKRQGAPSDHNLDTLDNIHAIEAEHIDEQAAAGPSAVNTLMPPSDPRPTEAERRQLGEWLACGAP